MANEALDRSDEVRFRDFVHREDREEWTTERMTLDRPLREDDYVRLTIESAQPGYLYIIDRDVYADGTQSKPTLRFPTQRLRGGRNHIEPGVPVEIPDIHDSPPAFFVERNRPNQKAVLLTIVVSPQPIPEITVEQDGQTLSEQLVKEWETRWGSKVQTIEDKGDLGKSYSLREKTAAEDPSNPLRHDDPVPLTLFHWEGRPGDPMLINAQLLLAAALP